MNSGQFFTISLIILSGIILGAVAVTNSVSSTFGSSDLAQSIIDHTDTELSHAVGAAVEDQSGAEGELLAARAFSDFRDYVEQQRSIQTDSIYLIGTPTDSGLRISVTNHRDEVFQDSWLIVDGTERYLGDLAAGESVIQSFGTTASSISATINGSGSSDSFTTPRKSFIYLDSTSRFGSSIYSDVRLY